MAQGPRCWPLVLWGMVCLLGGLVTPFVAAMIAMLLFHDGVGPGDGLTFNAMMYTLPVTLGLLGLGVLLVLAACIRYVRWRLGW